MTFIEVNPKIFQKDVEKKIQHLCKSTEMLFEKTISNIATCANKEGFFRKKIDLSKEDIIEIIAEGFHKDDAINEYIAAYMSAKENKLEQIKELQTLLKMVKYCANYENKHFLYLSKEDFLSVINDID